MLIPFVPRHPHGGIVRLLLAVALAVVPVTPGRAQQPPKPERPSTWKVRFDRPTTPDTAMSYVMMPPGWHVTSGPAAAGILYDPAWTARGNYRVEAETYLFPGDQLEGYGIFFGGQHLEDAQRTYTYFLIRKDGTYLIKQRQGGGTTTLAGWAPNPAIVKHPGDSSNVKNVLAVEVGADSVRFLANGQVVTTLPRAQVGDCDGTVGLRVNHHLNIHITRVDISPSAS
jgi:hypothetical protein